jgi:hypothetical protein
MQLTNEAHKYMIFFTKNYNSQDHINYDNQHFKSVIKTLYNDMRNASLWANNTFDKSKIVINKIDIISQIPRPDGFNSRWIDSEIKQHIFNNSSYKLGYKFHINKRRVNVNFVLENDIHKDIYCNYIKDIMTWISIADKYSCNSCGKELNLYIYMTNIKKHLPRNRWDTISSMEVNSGLSDMCRRQSEIIIFRKEEWFKLLIHETFHNYGLDFSVMNINKLTSIMKNHFHIESEFLMFETYTEFWARLINVMFCTFKIEDNVKFTDFYMFFQVLYYYERLFSILQCCKILSFMNLTFDMLINKKDKSLSLQLYKESTNVFPYYIAMSILMIDPINFVNWCGENNINIFRFQKTDETITSFGNYIVNESSKEKTLQTFEKMFKLVSKLPSDMKTTTKMTICETK